MATGAAPRLLTDLYVARLQLIRNRAGALVANAFASVDLAHMTEAQWADLFLSLYVAWVGAQLQAITTVDGYLTGTVVANGAALPQRSLVRDLLVGRSSGDSLILDVLTATRRVVDYRTAAGDSPLVAALASQAYLSAEIGSDPHRIARDTVLDAAQGDGGPIVGWKRVAEPGACAFCRMLATRGAVYTSQATASVTAGAKKYHRHCRCVVESVATVFERKRSIKAGADEWQRMLTDGQVPPRLRPRVPATTVTDVDLTRLRTLQLQQLEASIPDLQQRLASGDLTAAKPLAWQQGRVDDLRRQLATAAAA